MNLLEVNNLSVQYGNGQGGVLAVEGVDLSVGVGEFVGLAGESGCGKTTLAMAIPNLLPKYASITSGKIEFDGKELTNKSESELNEFRWRDISVIFQGALNALNPVATIGHQIVEPILVHEPGTSYDDALARAKELLEAVGISASRANSFSHEFSGGMRQRVMIAMSLACRPKLVIADEPITALDVMTQAQILELLRGLSKSFNLSMLLISHDLSVLAETCDRVQIMYAGKVAEVGNTEDVFGKQNSGHPYTRRLLNSYPNIYEERKFIDGIPGYPPDLSRPQAGCRFAARCDLVMERCFTDEPALLEISSMHKSACHLLEGSK
jgi:peptide/nickel transport system ATP-binding protein